VPVCPGGHPFASREFDQGELGSNLKNQKIEYAVSSVLQPVVKPVQPVRDRCVKHALNLETETLDATLIDVSRQKTGLIIFKEVRRGRASATAGISSSRIFTRFPPPASTAENWEYPQITPILFRFSGVHLTRRNACERLEI
jgi:hypothetical protein